jgi:hypothetical protein
VLVHGGFVDGSGWQGVYDTLRKKGYNVSVAAENGAILAGKKGPVVRLRHGCRQRH